MKKMDVLNILLSSVKYEDIENFKHILQNMNMSSSSYDEIIDLLHLITMSAIPVDGKVFVKFFLDYVKDYLNLGEMPFIVRVASDEGIFTDDELSFVCSSSGETMYEILGSFIELGKNGSQGIVLLNRLRKIYGDLSYDDYMSLRSKGVKMQLTEIVDAISNVMDSVAEPKKVPPWIYPTEVAETFSFTPVYDGDTNNIRRKDLVSAYYNDETVYRNFGPANGFLPGKNDGSLCSKLGSCRMLCCNHYDESEEENDEGEKEDWFTENCDFCSLVIRDKRYAVRIPMLEGGWSGCYCSIECIRKALFPNPEDNEVIVDTPAESVDFTLALVNAMEKRLLEVGIQNSQTLFPEEQDEAADAILVQSPLPLPFKAMTYNICWGCMSANETSKFDSTARDLAVSCQRKGKDVCMDKVVEIIIDNIPGGLDFICLQEAARWRDIYGKLPKNYGFCHSLVKLERGAVADLATFYDKTKYVVKYASSGDLNQGIGRPGDGRPWHVLFMESLTNPAKRIILLNLHDGHRTNAATNTVKISAGISHCVPVTSTEMENIPEGAGGDISAYLQELEPSAYSAIMLGDFNDHGHKDYFRTGVTPFSGTTIKGIRFGWQQNDEPCGTCCHSREDKYIESGFYLYGDYILTSENVKQISGGKPDLSKYDFMPSDHVPFVMTMILP